MKQQFLGLFLILCASAFLHSCNDDDTYADRVKRERSLISSFIRNGICIMEEEELNDTALYVPPIKVISEAQFAAQDSTTDVSQNEYVLLSGSGVYMQIIHKGAGKKLAHDEGVTVLNRYMEYNLQGDSIQTRNNTSYYIATPDAMQVTNSYGVFTASFVSGVMRTTYSASVPGGWLIPLSYINLGRAEGDEDDALVRIIVPHSEGQEHASENVYPCFYEIKYRKGRD